MPLTGTIVWLLIALAGTFLTLKQAAWVLFLGTGSIFYFITPFQQLFSRIGVAMMLISLSIRIVFELFTVVKFQHIDLCQAASK